MTDVPYNAGEPKHVKAARKAAREAQRDQDTFLQTIMSSTVGRRWMYDKLVGCHIFSTSHTGNALNTAFAEGERNIGLGFLNDIMQACPDYYIVMMREANDRSVIADTRRTTSEPRRDDPGPEPDGAEPDDDSTNASPVLGDDNLVKYDA